eukprot:TRINITY_DN2735_c0_g2_i1.p1 TRINITY_DN2735_c0_g2~~TRINITY_DN2735_c0_g2_i1.p1  ORF type:complete len:125 (+),score=9.20 TRINITY_DN2735_c0_g2_i1:84-458(+)
MFHGTLDEKSLRYLRKYCDYFSELALQDYECHQFLRFNLACSIIALARKCIGLLLPWNEELEELTSLSWIDIETPFRYLFVLFSNSSPDLAQKCEKYCELSQLTNSRNQYQTQQTASDTSMIIE